MKLPDLTETEIQEAVCAHIETYGKPGLVWWHTPNGGRRSPQWAAALKRRGVKPGVFDLVFLYKDRFYAMELKAPKGRLSPEQYGWRFRVDEQGGFTGVANSIESARKMLLCWDLVRA